jgi:putative PIN family toxin of toxin-antitoxin system
MPSSGRRNGPKIVFDTNVLVSAWFWEGNESRLMESVEEDLIHGYSSKQLIEELCRTLRYPKFNLSQDEVESIRSYYLLLFEIVNPKQTIDIILEDPSDNMVLECALEAEADYIVSGDHHILKLGEFKDIKIVTSAVLLEILSTREKVGCQ